MFTFLGWIFWLAVFLAGIFFLFATSTFNLDIELNEEKENENGAPVFNEWITTASLIFALLAAMLSSWWMGFLHVFIFFFFLFWLYMIYQILIYFGVEFNSKGAEVLQKFKEEVIDNGFPKKYAPLITSIFASFFIAVISLSGLDSGSSSSSSASSYSSSSNSSSSSKDRYSIGSDGHPLKNGKYYAFSSGYIAGEIFNITIAQGGSVQGANSRCYQAMTSRAREGGDDYNKCDQMVDSASNSSYFQSMRNNKTYK
jgi:hypothetical protein|tara:strand:+ start:179 stop:946 length:768 start_codon:yes stop_codon:yes gene_type:complete